MNFARNNAKPNSTGHCGLHVNNALRAYGIKSYGHGKDVARNLVKSNQGWKEVAYSKGYMPQHGDVMSIDGYTGQKRTQDGQLPGHVAIYDAKQQKWVSDYVQRNRGNTAATNDALWRNILNGSVKVTIARKQF